MNAENPKIVKSRDTGKTYRVVREYKHTIRVVAAWKKNGLPFTIDRASVE